MLTLLAVELTASPDFQLWIGPVTAPANYKDPLKIDAYIENARARAVERAASIPFAAKFVRAEALQIKGYAAMHFESLSGFMAESNAAVFEHRVFADPTDMFGFLANLSNDATQRSSLSSDSYQLASTLGLPPWNSSELLNCGSDLHFVGMFSPERTLAAAGCSMYRRYGALPNMNLWRGASSAIVRFDPFSLLGLQFEDWQSAAKTMFDLKIPDAGADKENGSHCRATLDALYRLTRVCISSLIKHP